MAFQDFYDEVQKLYIAYYQRPADPGGLRFWAQRLEAASGSLEGIIDAFATSPEAVSLYDSDGDGAIDLDDADDMIDAIYQALFNRAPDAAGKQFYLDALTNGQFPDGRPATPGRVALDILNGARNDDAVAIANKLQMATTFTSILDPDNDGIGPFTATYAGTDDEVAGRDFLAQFTADPTTLKTQGQVADDIRTTIANTGDPILSPTTLALTTGVDNINITDPGSFDQVTGIVDGDGDADTANSTFTPGDVIDGNGLTELRLTVVESGDAAFATVKDVSEVNLIAGDSVSVTFNAADWSNVDSIHYAGGVDGMGAFFDNLSANRVDLVIDFTTTGTLAASYTDGLSVSMDLSGEGGKASFIDGNFAVTAAASGTVSISVTTSGDLSLGDLGATVGDSGSLDVFISTTGDVGQVSLGDVNLELGNLADASYTVSVSSTGTIDSITIGDVSVVLGTSASLDTLSYSISAAGNIGSVTVGDVNADIGQDADFDDYTLSISASGSIDTVTVGDLVATLAIDGSLSYTVDIDGDLGVGTVTVGDVELTLDDGASVDYFLTVSATSGTINTVTVGDLVATLAVSGSLSYSVDISGDLGVGDVTFGDVSVSAVSASSVLLTYSISASSGDVGTVTFGDISLAAQGTMSMDFEVDVFASGDAGQLTLGDVNLSTTVSSTINFSLDSNGGTDGDISLGNVVLDFNSGTSADLNLNIGHATYTGDINIASLQVFQTVTDDALIVDLSDITADFSAATLTQQLTIGTVDFSGFVNNDPDAADADTGVSIDVSGIVGDVQVIGSDFDDTITDNAETNTLTGGDGADVFSFVAGNTGKTLATVDEVTDFEAGVDTIELDVAAAPTVGEYGEGTFANFAAFISAANASIGGDATDLFAGQVGSDTFVAVETSDTADAVTYVIQLTGVSIADLGFGDFAFV